VCILLSDPDHRARIGGRHLRTSSLRVRERFRHCPEEIAGLMAFAQPAMGQTITGRVVGVSDGDSLTLLVSGNRQVKVRLEGIDAPENGQEFSRNAKEGLSRLVFGKEISLDVIGIDRYDRTLGVVHVGGVNANLTLVQQGLAWHYKEYSDDRALAQAEVDARAARRGLWSGFNPIPPWEYRALTRGAQGGAGASPAASDPPPGAATAFWLNSSSNVRHNPSCRWFGKTKRGRYCGPTDGKACGDCGGVRLQVASPFRGQRLTPALAQAVAAAKEKPDWIVA
jgi:endonuclease YncB( thermonuclease family)